ncbi:MAG TPA: hypothetical protein GXX37_03015 [Clostridiaceae bacterium]|nr:hypothetical protein [Clostridiaceae bacterium]
MEIGKKECEYCHESIDERARRCPFCGSLLNIRKKQEIQHYLEEQEHPEKQDSFVGQLDDKSFSDEEDYLDTGNNQYSQDLLHNYDDTPTSYEESIEEGPEGEKIFYGEDIYKTKERFSDYNLNNNYAKSKVNYTQNRNYFGSIDNKSVLTNGMKVFITVISSVVPGLGQIAGIILAIIFMNSEDDVDKRSFGVALLVASLILFVISCFSCFLLILFSGEFLQNIQ